MKYEDLMKLENGTLLKIKGRGAFGETNILIHFRQDYVYQGKGYFLGATLYPLEWLYLATESDYKEAVKKANENHERTLKDLKVSYEKTKKAGK